MNLTFTDISYRGVHACATWHGLSLRTGSELSAFIKGEVANRLYDIPGRDEFDSYLRGLSMTGMGRDCLEEILNAEIPEERSWAFGEALAEAILIQGHGVVFPWNMSRDMRNPRSSLPGADIVGFLPTDSGFRLLLGEVKTSSEEKHPPQVMSGRGIGHQLDSLAHDMQIINQLLRWLLPRVKNTKHETAFNQSATLYFDSGMKAASLFGILIRDTLPNELDLQTRGKDLGHKLSEPMSCELIAIYLPFKIPDFPNHLGMGV